MLIDWDDEGNLPNKIYCFLDLTSADLPHVHGTEHEGTHKTLSTEFGITKPHVPVNSQPDHGVMGVFCSILSQVKCLD